MAWDTKGIMCRSATLNSWVRLHWSAGLSLKPLGKSAVHTVIAWQSLGKRAHMLLLYCFRSSAQSWKGKGLYTTAMWMENTFGIKLRNQKHWLHISSRKEKETGWYVRGQLNYVALIHQFWTVVHHWLTEIWNNLLTIWAYVIQSQWFCHWFHHIQIKTHSSVLAAKKTKEDVRHTNLLFTGTIKLPNSAYCISETTMQISTKFIYFLPYI